MRHEISLPIAIAAISSPPETGRTSASARPVATAGPLMCTIDSLWVSSNSVAQVHSASLPDRKVIGRLRVWSFHPARQPGDDLGEQVEEHEERQDDEHERQDAVDDLFERHALADPAQHEQH